MSRKEYPEYRELFSNPDHPQELGLRFYLSQRDEFRQKPGFPSLRELVEHTNISSWLGETEVLRALNELEEGFPELTRYQGKLIFTIVDDLVIYILNDKVKPDKPEADNNLWRDLARHAASLHSDFWINEDGSHNDHLWINDIFSRNKTRQDFFNQMETYRQMIGRKKPTEAVNEVPLIDATSPNRVIGFNKGEDDSQPQASLGFRLPEVDEWNAANFPMQRGAVEIMEDRPAEPEAIEVDRPMPKAQGPVLAFLRSFGRRLHDIDEETLVKESVRLEHLIRIGYSRQKLEYKVEEIATVQAGPLDEKIFGPARRLLRDYTRLDPEEIEPVIRAIEKQVAARLTEELLDIFRIEAEDGWGQRTVATRKEMVSYLKASVAPLLEALVRKYPPKKAYLRFKGVSRLARQAMAKWA
jgi:hypothetical protein